MGIGLSAVTVDLNRLPGILSFSSIVCDGNKDDDNDGVYITVDGQEKRVDS